MKITAHFALEHLLYDAIVQTNKLKRDFADAERNFYNSDKSHITEKATHLKGAKECFEAASIRLLYTKEGKFYDTETDNPKDLFMEGTKKEGWINLYKAMEEKCIGCVHSTKKEAMSKIIKDGGIICIDTVKVEWEE